MAVVSRGIFLFLRQRRLRALRKGVSTKMRPERIAASQTSQALVDFRKREDNDEINPAKYI